MEIEGYSDYLIHDDGRVWSKKGKGRFLEPRKIKGYHQVCLYRDGKRKSVYASRLVALNFIPNPENKPEVDHIDRNPSNNHVSNLRWVTRQENQDNKGMRTDNTSGHKYVSYNEGRKKWIFRYSKKGHKVYKRFETKNDALCFKWISLMRIKSTMDHNGSDI